MVHQKTPKRGIDWSAVILGAGLIFVLLVVLALGLGAALMWSWSLFMVPVFGLPLLSIQEAMGAVVILFIIATPFRSKASASVKR